MLGLQTALPIAWEVLSPHLGPERIFALMSAQPAAIARLTATDPRARRPQRAGRTGRGRARRPTCACSTPPRRRWWTRRGLASRSRNTPYAGPHVRRRGAPHRAAGRAGRDRRDGATVSAAAEPATATGRRRCWSPPTARVRRRGRRRGGPRGDGRARLQHGHERLPGGDHRPVLRGAGDLLHQHPHRQLRDERGRRRGRRAALPGRRGVRPGRRAVELARHRGPRALPAPPRRARPDRRRHPAPGPARPPGRRGAVRVRHGAGGGAAGRRRGRRRHRRHGPGLGRHGERGRASTRRPAPAPRAACASWPTTSASRRPWSSCSPRSGPSRWCPPARAADEVLALEPDGVFLSNGPGDPAALPGPDRGGGRPGRPRARLRHLPRPPDPRHRARRLDLQAALRPPRRQPSRAAPRDRRRRDHEPEPQLRRGRRLHPRRRDDARQPQRRRDRGLPLPDGAGLLGAVPPRGGAGPPRRPLPLRRLPRPHAGPSRPRGRRRRRGRADAAPRRPAVDPRHRVGPDRDRPGLRVRLLGHPGLPGPGRGGLPGHPGQLQPGHDHDGPRHGRPDLHRAARPRGADGDHREGAARRAAADARRPDRAEPDHGAGRARRPRALRGRGHRRAARGDRDGRGPGPLQGGHGGDRPRGAALGLRPLAAGGGGDRGRHRLPDHGAAELHPRRQGDRHRRGRRRTSASSPPRAWPPARSARSWWSSRSPAGRSSSSR